MTQDNTNSNLFRWACLASSILFGVVLIWIIIDFKLRILKAIDKAEGTVSEVQSSVEEVNSQLPEILTEIRQTSQTLSRVSEDVELMKRVAGIGESENTRGVRGLALYMEELQLLLSNEFSKRQGVILIEEVIGSDLKKEEEIHAFLVGLSKEMVLSILPLSNSKEEVLYRVCHSGIRKKPFYVQFDGEEPQKLGDFIRERHPESRDLPEFDPKAK